MRNLAVSNDTYASDWADRQFTACPDDAGPWVATAWPTASRSAAWARCSPATTPTAPWGWWCGGPLCGAGYPGAGYWAACFPYCFVPQSTGNLYFGAFRLPTTKAFNQYVGDRWYDKSFWAPNDVIPLRIAEKMFDYPGEFLPYLPEDDSNQQVAYSSYVWSPAKMYHPDVSGKLPPARQLRRLQEPRGRPVQVPRPQDPDGRAPLAPEQRVEANPSFGGNDPSWLFTQATTHRPSASSSTAVGVKGVREAMDADKRAEALQQQQRLQPGVPERLQLRAGPLNRGMARSSATDRATAASTATTPLITPGCTCTPPAASPAATCSPTRAPIPVGIRVWSLAGLRAGPFLIRMPEIGDHGAGSATL